MSAFTTPRKSLRLRKTEPSPFFTNRKRELFPVDNWDEDSHDIAPLQSSPEVYDVDSPDTSFNMNCTPITELSPTMSDKFERLMSGSKNGHTCSATIIIEETPNSRRIKNVDTTPFESETNKEVKTPKKSFSLNNKTVLGVKTLNFYGSNQISLEDLRVKRFTRLNYNPKVKAKLFKDTKSTSKKRPRSTSHEKKSKVILFPGVTLPFKKKPTIKKPIIKIEVCEEKDDFIENHEEQEKVVKKNYFDISKSSSKNVWAEYIKQEKPERIKIEDSDNRKFFKSKVIHNDIPIRKDNSFNFKVVNWGDENRMSTVDYSDFNNTEILDDGTIEQIGQEVNELIDLLDDEEDDYNDSRVVRYPGLSSNSTKRNHEDQDDEDSCEGLDSKRLKSDIQSQNTISRCQMPDLIKDTYAIEGNYHSAYSSQKNVSSTFEFNNMVIDESNTSNGASVTLNESPQTKLFPIFTNQTPSPSQVACGKPTARRIKRIIDATQYQIDAGQKKFGGFLCQQCGLYYSRGEPEDEAEHDKYHAAKDIFKYNSFKNEKVLYQDTTERIVVISGSDSKMACTKALEVISFVDVELGFNTQNSVLPTTKKVYLYIKDKQVIGCLVVELISEAYRNLETETEDMVIVSEESYPVKVGVNRIWTKWDCRKNGIASKLLDCFRKNYAYGHILTLHEIAFTVPTRAGKQFIKKYTNKNDYFVYTGW